MTRLSSEITAITRRAAELISQAHKTVVLTGAGISTPSGIPDFRSPGDGLWSRFSPLEVASLSAFRYDPEKFYLWLHPLARALFNAKPNPAHLALAELENYGFITMVVTQNIDGLHTRAGTQNVLEVHGTLSTLTCINCFKQVASDGFIQNYVEKLIIPRCPDCGGILKPDIILYEEQLPYKTWYKAEAVSRECDLMIVAGTSLEVMPAAKLPMLAMDNGASLININNTATYIDERAEITINADVAQVLPLIAHEVLND